MDAFIVKELIMKNRNRKSDNMNKKGFTLVEVLAVIVILAIIMIIVVPNVFEALNAGKNKISDIERSHIVDASERLILEAINCDFYAADDVDVFNYIFEKNISTCSEMSNLVFSETLETTVEKLREKGYFNDDSNKCNGKVKMTTDNNYKVSVDTTGVTCN